MHILFYEKAKHKRSTKTEIALLEFEDNKIEECGVPFHYHYSQFLILLRSFPQDVVDFWFYAVA